MDTSSFDSATSIAGCSSSVGCAPAWYSDGRGFNPPVRKNSFVDIGHEFFSTHSEETEY